LDDNTLVQVPITAGNVAQVSVSQPSNFTGTGKDTLFTGEPDGHVYSWTGNDATNPLQRQLFSDAYVGKAWQAMCGVQMPAFGKGLAGLMVDPTNQSVCNVIFWSPQAVLPTPQPSLIETAPFAAVIPSASPLGSNAVVTIRYGTTRAILRRHSSNISSLDRRVGRMPRLRLWMARLTVSLRTSPHRPPATITRLDGTRWPMLAQT